MRKADAPKSPAGPAHSTAGGKRLSILNLPNLLTGSRILLIPVFVLLFVNPTPSRALWAAIVFGLASATDLLDGYFARKMAQVTQLGKLMDPIADKLLVLSALILLVQFQRVSAILAILIVGREIVITGMRLIAANQGIIIPAERLGKFKTGLQVISITLLIVDPRVMPLWRDLEIQFWALTVLWISLALSLISGFQYITQYSRKIRQKT